MAKRIYIIIHKQYGKEAFKRVYPFTSRLVAAKAMANLYKTATNGENYVSPVHYTQWGRYTPYNDLNIDSFHVSCRDGNEQSVELTWKFEGEPIMM